MMFKILKNSTGFMNYLDDSTKNSFCKKIEFTLLLCTTKKQSILVLDTKKSET